MKYALGVIGVIIVAFLAIFLITSHSSNDGSTANSPKKPAGINLLDYDNANSAVKVTIQGQLVGEDQRQDVRITVSQKQRTVELLNGYEENVSKSETFGNTAAAYGTFLRALNNALFTTKRKGVTTDERGVCPLGHRYIYELTSGSDQVQRLWSDACVAKEGTFAGNGPLVRELFQNQVPDYNQFLEGSHIFN